MASSTFRILTKSGIFTLLLLAACTTPETVETVQESAYFPMEAGRFRLYDVIEERFTPNETPVRSLYQEKEQIIRLEQLADGSMQAVLSRSRRQNSSESWIDQETIVLEKWPDRLVLTEKNQKFIPLVFPIDASTIWNANRLNSRQETKNRYTDIGISNTINGLFFEKTIRVVQQDDSTAIDRTLRAARYALNVGLVEEEQTVLQYCQRTTDCIGQGIIESGSRRIRRLVASGQD
ncbi:hypothetical protein [Arundinibacter roseus]|uniref:Uncharacterized protein n=1 Tax=Arundinibacter roseus TaxID=2070510 RepID=A0A4R4KHC2_9BACT|nr:hypothetical protein [Arundinibacter roseus]TDB66041.1 hypothetical protein EZE20_09785 [Arundinibacter roseus]